MLVSPPPSKLDAHWTLLLLTHLQNAIGNEISRLHALPSFSKIQGLVFMFLQLRLSFRDAQGKELYCSACLVH